MRAEARKPLVAALRARLAAANVDAFFVAATDFDVFTNDDETTTFLALRLEEASTSAAPTRERRGGFAGLIAAVDAALRAKGHPTFYADPKPHASVMWAPGNVSRALRKIVSETKGSPGLGFRGWAVPIERVACAVSGSPEVAVWARLSSAVTLPPPPSSP